MSDSKKKAVKYSGIITGLPFMTIAGYYIGVLIGSRMGSPWDESLPILGGLLFFTIVIIELIIIEINSSRKTRETMYYRGNGNLSKIDFSKIREQAKSKNQLDEENQFDSK
ncbi:MAG: hypothetical protein ACTSRU_01415 [Candidatus Hodarchaeales archaeon]